MGLTTKLNGYDSFHNDTVGIKFALPVLQQNELKVSHILFATFIVITFSTVYADAAIAQDDATLICQLTIYRDQNTLTLFLLDIGHDSGCLLSLLALMLQVQRADGTNHHQGVGTLPRFLGLNNETATSICLYLYLDSAEGTLPLNCQLFNPIAVHRHPLHQADVFWFDYAAGQPRLINVFAGETTVGTCPALQVECDFTFLPTSPTNAEPEINSTPSTPPSTLSGCRVTGNNVNIRVEPSTEHAIAGTLNGEGVVTSQSTSGWYRIEFAGIPGWVSKAVVSVTGDCSEIPMIAIQTSPLPTNSQNNAPNTSQSREGNNSGNSDSGHETQQTVSNDSGQSGDQTSPDPVLESEPEDTGTETPEVADSSEEDCSPPGSKHTRTNPPPGQGGCNPGRGRSKSDAQSGTQTALADVLSMAV